MNAAEAVQVRVQVGGKASGRGLAAMAAERHDGLRGAAGAGGGTGHGAAEHDSPLAGPATIVVEQAEGEQRVDAATRPVPPGPFHTALGSAIAALKRQRTGRVAG